MNSPVAIDLPELDLSEREQTVGHCDRRFADDAHAADTQLSLLQIPSAQGHLTLQA